MHKTIMLALSKAVCCSLGVAVAYT